MTRTPQKLATTLTLTALLLASPVRADDPAPLPGGQDPPYKPTIIQAPVLDILVEAYAALVTSLVL